MQLSQFVHRVLFRLQFQPVQGKWLRKWYYGVRGMRIGTGTHLPRMDVNWPHQVAIGRDCTIEADVDFKFEGPWRPGPAIVIGDGCFVGRGCEFNATQGIAIGHHSLIASGCKFIDHYHIYSDRNSLIGEQPCLSAPISIGDDVWLGLNVVVLPGVEIGRGAVVGAGAVVRTAVPEYEVWAGVPARRIKMRGDRSAS